MNIETLRQELAEVDRSLLEFVAKRQELARSIGHIKDRGGVSLRDYAQEKEVLQRARETAAQLGISTELASALMRQLIGSSLTAQERQRVEALGGGSGQKALIIGGSGRMGAWLVRFLASQGFAVEVADPALPADDVPHISDWRQSSLDHDLIAVTANLRATQAILEELAGRRPAGVIFDIGSLKTPLRDPLEKLAGQGLQVASIHPMFGPDTELLSGRHVIVVDLGCRVATERVRDLFSSTMAELVEMRLDDHDRFIAYVLGLSHALNIAFMTALSESGEAAPQLARLSSTTFDRQLAVAAAVAQDNPHLYFEIQHLNAYGDEPLEALQAAVGKVVDVVRSGDEPAFVNLMEQGRVYLEDRRENPYAF